MAAPMLYSNIVNNADLWDQHDPDHGVLMGVVGGGAATNQTDTARHIVNTATRSPTMVAFILTGDEDHIHVGYNPTFYPAEVGNATPFDDLAVVFVGNNLVTATPVVLPAEAFARIANTRCKTIDAITGPLGHGAGPPAVTRSGPHGAAEANTDEVRCRRAFLLPANRVHDALTTQADGRYSHIGFYGTFLQAGLGDGDAAVVAAHQELATWYRCASTNTAANHTLVTVTPATSALPLVNQRLNAWTETVRARELAKLGAGGPGLTTAAFQAGVANLRDTMNDTAAARLQFERDRDNRTFTQKHGDALAQRMYNWTGAVDDDTLPEVHRLLAKSPKARDYGILSSLIHARVAASTVPLTASNAPLPTTKLVDDVFRSLMPAGTGLVFAQGLTPFAVVCEGHAEMELVRKKIKQAEQAEAGTTISLADAETLVTTDVRMAATPQAGAEKLYGFSILVDLFHGVARPIAINIRCFSVNAGPALHRIAEQYADNPANGMDLVNRVLYEVQQEYFAYVTALAENPAAMVPTFMEIESKVLTYRAESLSPLPASWYTLFEIAHPTRGGPALTARPTPRSQAGTVATVSANPDRLLLTRFEGSGFSSVNAMLQGHEVEIPKHANKPVCLVWALKGRCSSGCRRKDQHVRYSRDTNSKLHALLDACGVANPQE